MEEIMNNEVEFEETETVYTEEEFVNESGDGILGKVLFGVGIAAATIAVEKIGTKVVIPAAKKAAGFVKGKFKGKEKDQDETEVLEETEE